MNRKQILYIVLSLIFSLKLGAQYYNTGQDPAAIKWKQLKSSHFHFIFPADYEQEARRTAYIFEKSYKLTGGSYGEDEIYKFPVIIHNHSIESNGYVAWAPKRVELYPTPGQNSIPLFHSSQLALHELIHVSQLQALRKGLSSPMEYIFGQQYTGALSIFTPFWFLEGEAVIAETKFSYSGRGRQPDFEKRLKAMILDDKKDFSYDKLISGSYKNYTPDHYQFGYQMTAYTRSRWGDNIFTDALDYTSKRPYTLNPFNISLRKNTGSGKEEIFNSTINYLRSEWGTEDSLLIKSDFTYYDKRNSKDYISYHSPVLVGRDSLIAIKSSLSHSPSFVLLTDSGQKEIKLFTPGYIWPYRITSNGSIITWAENIDDPRWDNRSYSIIKTYDINTGLMKVLTRKSRLFSPAISPDGIYIAAAESSEDYINKILIIDRFTGETIKSANTPGNVLVVNPQWSSDGKYLAFISSGEKGEGIMIYNTRDDNFETRLAAGYSDLQSLAIRDDSLYYIASYSGINNAYRLDPSDNIDQLTSSRFGISDISLRGEQMYFSDYSSNGNRPASFPVSTVYKKLEAPRDKELLLIKDIDSSSKLGEFTDYKYDNYTVSPYKKWQHLFNFHSWMPFYADLNNLSFDNIGVSPGLTLMSQNHLSTLTSTIAYEYTNNDHFLHSSIIWEGQYPAVELDLSYGGSPFVAVDEDSLHTPASINPGLNASALIYLPLSFNSGKFYQTVYPSLRLSYNNNYIYKEASGLFDYGQLIATGRIYLANFHRMANRDIYPRWGQVLDIFGTISPGDKSIYGPVKTLRTSFYAPGIFNNHGVRIMYQAEKQDPGKYAFINRIPHSRGYENIISKSLTSFSADYVMPLVYPDINIKSFLYINRIRSTFFYDYSLGTDNYYRLEKRGVEGEEQFTSFGLELLADFYMLRLPFRFSAGLQSAWMPENNDAFFKLLFNIDVFGFAIGKEPGFYR